jgi:hypothetical protein
MTLFCLIYRCDISVESAASIFVTSETSALTYRTTPHDVPEDGNVH